MWAELSERRTFNDHTFSHYTLRILGWMALERFCCILICIIANWRRLSCFYAYIVGILELKQNTEQRGCVCVPGTYVYIYFYRERLLCWLLVAADAALLAARQKESGPGKCKCVCECAKTGRALLSFPPFAWMRCCCVQKLKTTSFVSKIKAQRRNTLKIKVSLSLFLVDDCATKKKSCRSRPTALRVNLTCRTICN